MKTNIGITLDPCVLASVDSRRGLVPRSTFVEMILRKELGMDASSYGSSDPRAGRGH